MEKPAAFQATIHGFRTVPSRKVVQIIVEAPIEHQAEIARICEHNTWVAVARIQEPKGGDAPEGESRFTETPPALHDASERAVQNLASKGASTGRPAPVEESRASKRNWADLPPQTQAAIVGAEPAFWMFAQEQHEVMVLNEAHAAEFIRQFCGNLTSRKQLETDHRARVLWHGLANQYRTWRDHPELVS